MPGGSFIAHAFLFQVDEFHIEAKEVPIEGANDMTAVKRYQSPFRRFYAIFHRDAPGNGDGDTIEMAIKSFNESISRHGVDPWVLMYSTFSRGFPTIVLFSFIGVCNGKRCLKILKWFIEALSTSSN